jgi:hypothetical protein
LLLIRPHLSAFCSYARLNKKCKQGNTATTKCTLMCKNPFFLGKIVKIYAKTNISAEAIYYKTSLSEKQCQRPIALNAVENAIT